MSLGESRKQKAEGRRQKAEGFGSSLLVSGFWFLPSAFYFLLKARGIRLSTHHHRCPAGDDAVRKHGERAERSTTSGESPSATRLLEELGRVHGSTVVPPARRAGDGGHRWL